MTRRSTVDRLAGIAERLRAARDPVALPANRSAWLRSVRGWQARRLALSFADFEAYPHYRKAVTFFLEDLYGEQDMSWRDRDLVRMMPTMVRWLPEAMLETVADALELDWISHVLDLRVASRLEESVSRGAAVVDIARYASAYSAAGTRAERERQIDLLMAVGRELESIVRKPVVYAVLRLARGPAASAGLGGLQSFLERGFAAFRELGSASHFLQTIEERERRAMEGLLAGRADALGRGFDLQVEVLG
jgi:hypothetical protein